MKRAIKIKINDENVTPKVAQRLADSCPFSAIEYESGKVRINSECRLCGQCVEADTDGVLEAVYDTDVNVDAGKYYGIAVYAELLGGGGGGSGGGSGKSGYGSESSGGGDGGSGSNGGENGGGGGDGGNDSNGGGRFGSGVAPISLELLGKALELARGDPVYVVAVGYKIGNAAEELRRYGAASVYLYDSPELEIFEAQRYSVCLRDFVSRVKPAAFLIGATGPGRSLAPRVAAAFRTGLTADCTGLEIEDGLLVQTRPAFGGNIMARIITKHRRPQMCTVRYRVFDAPPRGEAAGKIVYMNVPDFNNIKTKILSEQRRPPVSDISEAERIVAVGRGAADGAGLSLCKELAGLIGAQIACSRPLAETGVFEQRRQIGLSGRIVKPKLLIAVGVSGAVQFTSAIAGTEQIIAINPDKSAPIFNVAHHGYVGRAHEIIPSLLQRIKK